MVPVLGGADEVVAHLFLLSSVGGILGTVGLIMDMEEEGGGVKTIVYLFGFNTSSDVWHCSNSI